MIYIKGVGNAVLDGGLPNGLDERTSCNGNYPHVSENLTIYMHNVINFGIENITVTDQRWWSMAFMFASRGYIRDINFRLTRNEIDTYLPWRNQDGIDLRVGCNNIEISNIFGETGDDIIALTALAGEKFEIPERIENSDRDIHDISIHNCSRYYKYVRNDSSFMTFRAKNL